MTRYAKDHKDATRRRIVETSGRRLKSDGLAGSGVTALMADAGLTNGAFYAHFASKDDLVATVVAEELSAQCQAASGLAPRPAGVEQLVRGYLSVEHRDHGGEGCPSAALLAEIARGGERVRGAYTNGIVAFADTIAACIDPATPKLQRVRILAAFAGMAGTLQMARTVADPELSDALLEQGVDNALALLGVADA